MNVDETTVGEMEAGLEALRQAVYTENTDEGWRIHVLREENPLTSIGVRDGDLITYDSLKREMAKPERTGVAHRLASVLGNLEKM